MNRLHRISWILGIVLGLWTFSTIVVAMPAEGWMSLGISNARMPSRGVVLDQPGRTILDIGIPGMEIAYRAHNGITYQQLSLPYGGITHDVGQPSLPLITELVAIPDQGDVRVRVISVTTSTIPDVNVYPFLEPPPRDGQYVEPEFVLDKEIYQGRKLYPFEWARVSSPVIWRDVRIAPVIIQPCRWNPETKELTVATSIQVEVITEGTGGVSVKEHHFPKVSSRFASMYQDRVINWNTFSSGMDLSSEGSLLIITHPSFNESIMPFANWKHQKGFQTTVVSLDEIGANPSAIDIKAFINSAYYNWDTPPEYVILVGDYYLVPWWTGLDGSKTDHIYSTLEGNDYIADVVMARFSVETAQECNTLISKLVDYELNPYIVETGWYDAGMVVASNEGVDPENGLKVRRMLLNANFSIVDLFQQPVSNYAENLVNALNDGRSWAFYIGHGNSTAWSSTNPYFTNTHVNSLTNGRKLPAIVSIACSNANLDYSGGDCFAETWMTTASDRGAANVMAFTENCVFFFSDTLGLGIMRSHFEQGMPYFGNNVDYGRLYMFQSFPEGPGGTCERTMQQAMLLGDPTQLVWSDNPGIMTVTHPSEIPVGPSEITVMVTVDGAPVVGALVCAILESENIYEVGETNAAGIVTLPITSLMPGAMQLTVTSQNASPYLGNVTIASPSGPHVLYQSHSIIDSMGNGNGLLDLGEMVQLDLTLRNIGIEPATDVDVVLRTSNPHVIFIDSTHNFTAIPAGGAITASSEFTLSAGSDLVDGEGIGIEVLATVQGGSSWNSAFSIIGHAPDVVLVGVEIQDQNNNGLLEPGETAQLITTVQNEGSSAAPGVIGALEANNLQISIQSAPQSMGEIPPTGIAQAVYTVTASSTIPIGTSVTFMLNIDGSNGYTTQLTFNEYVGLMAAYLWDPDETPISSDSVATILTSMGLSYETGTTLPDALDRYGSVWVFLGMYGNNHVLSGTEGSNLAAYLDNGGALYMEGGDTWVYDFQTPVHPYFHIIGINDGWDDLSMIQGVTGTMTQGMSFDYTGENAFVDRLGAGENATLIFNNWNPEYGTTVSYDHGTYRTIGSSFELGGLVDASSPSTKADLVQRYLTFFQVFGEDLQPPEIIHQPLPNQSNELGPYLVEATITDPSGVASASVHYSVNGEDFTPISMNPIGNGVFVADIPDQSAGCSVRYYIEVIDASPSANIGTTPVYTFVILLSGSNVEFLASDYEDNDGQMTASSGGDWQWGSPASGPHSAHSGYNVWGTNLEGNYASNASSTLDTPPLDLRNIVSPILSVWQWYSFESSGNHMWDGGNVKVSVDGGPFEVLNPVGGYDGIMDNPANPLHGEAVFGTLTDGNYWHQRIFNLTSIQGHIVVIRFQIGSDGSNEAPGWYIDDILVEGHVFGPAPAIDDLTATIDGNDLYLSWSSATGAHEYHVYRAPLPNFLLNSDSYLAATAFPHYRDEDALLQSSQYFYRVVAISEYGVQGPRWMTDPSQGEPLSQQSPETNRTTTIVHRGE